MWLKIAHRGAAGTRPELTAPAFERAIELGADMIEIDVQMTRDRHLVVLHDLELGRTVPGNGAVRDLELAAIQTLDAGSWFDPAYAGAKVPSLTQVIDLLDGRASLNVEIKSPSEDWQATAEALLRVLHEARCAGSTLISSFSLGALRALRERDLSVRVAVLWYEANVHDSLRHAEELAAEAIHPHHSLVSENLIRRAAERGLRVNAWTVNEVVRMRQLAELGIGGLISDFPERFAEVAV